MSTLVAFAPGTIAHLDQLNKIRSLDDILTLNVASSPFTVLTDTYLHTTKHKHTLTHSTKSKQARLHTPPWRKAKRDTGSSSCRRKLWPQRAKPTCLLPCQLLNIWFVEEGVWTYTHAIYIYSHTDTHTHTRCHWEGVHPSHPKQPSGKWNDVKRGESCPHLSQTLELKQIRNSWCG